MGRTLKHAKADAFVKHLEEQGAKVRKTKSGYMITSITGDTVSIHRSPSSDRRGKTNEISSFRRVGLHHPEDKREIDEVVAKNEEGYPLYMVGPVTNTTRKRLLEDLESKGWPVRITAKEINIDTATALRALYAVGYRWEEGATGKNKIWVAPQNIIDLHEQVRAEQERLAEEAREERKQQRQETMAEKTRQAEVSALASMTVVPECEDVGAQVNDQLDKLADAIRDVTKGDDETTDEVEPPRDEMREFIDSVDSWTVGVLPGNISVADYVSMLRHAGLSVEIRVWKA